MATQSTARNLLDEARKRYADGDTLSDNPERFDYAIKWAGDRYARAVGGIRTVDETLALDVGNAWRDLSSITGFKAARLIRLSIAHPLNAAGVEWADATSYVEGEIVRDGAAANDLYYVAKQDHTSDDGTNDPPNDDFWEPVGYDRGYECRRTDYRTIARYLNFGVEGEPLFPEVEQSIAEGRPLRFGFRTNTDAYFHPVPDKAWRIRLIYDAPFTDITIGEAVPGSVELNIPDEHFYDVIALGAVLFLARSEPSLSGGEPADLAAEWRDFLNRARADMSPQSPVVTAYEGDYL